VMSFFFFPLRYGLLNYLLGTSFKPQSS
jgi:hypothetical protein